MSATRSLDQQAASRGPATDACKAGNGTRHGLYGSPFALPPKEDREEFAELHATVTADWGPRDAYEQSDSAAV